MLKQRQKYLSRQTAEARAYRAEHRQRRALELIGSYDGCHGAGGYIYYSIEHSVTDICYVGKGEILSLAEPRYFDEHQHAENSERGREPAQIRAELAVLAGSAGIDNRAPHRVVYRVPYPRYQKEHGYLLRVDIQYVRIEHLQERADEREGHKTRRVAEGIAYFVSDSYAVGFVLQCCGRRCHC